MLQPLPVAARVRPRAPATVLFRLTVAAGAAGLVGGCTADPTGTTPLPIGDHGTLVVAVTTTGDDVEAAGYLVRIGLDLDSARVASTGRVVLTGLEVGTHRIALLAVPGNCVVEGGGARDVRVAADAEAGVAFAVRCMPWASLPAGVVAVAGDWRARTWEFIPDPSLGSPQALSYELIGMGVTGTLRISPATGTGVRWEWHETYRWWASDLATVITGRASTGADALTLDAVAESIDTHFECDLGDCEGPLHGSYHVAREDDALVLTRTALVSFYYVNGPYLRWSRLTLERIR
jgi:hypothetical protein